MASKTRYQGHLDEEAPLDGPLASPDWCESCNLGVLEALCSHSRQFCRALESMRSLLTRQSRQNLVVGGE